MLRALGAHAEEELHSHTVFTDRAIYMKQGGRIDCMTPGTLAALYANWIIVASEKRLMDGRRHGAMHRRSVEQIIARALLPDA